MSLYSKKSNFYTWEIVSSVQSSKLIKSVIIWFLIIPILAKAIESEAISSYIPEDLELPFSWGYFYLSSTMFFISSIFHSIFCPEIIKKYSGIDDYLKKNGSIEYLKTLLIKIIYKESIRYKHELIVKLLGNTHVSLVHKNKFELDNQIIFREYYRNPNFVKEKYEKSEHYSYKEAIEYIPAISDEIFSDWELFIRKRINFKSSITGGQKHEDISEVFSLLVQAARINNPIARNIILLLHVVGFISLSYVAYQNILYVFNYYLSIAIS